MVIVEDRPVLSSERAPHINRPATVYLVLGPIWVLDTKADWPIHYRS
jgi:hypothetical protein